MCTKACNLKLYTHAHPKLLISLLGKHIHTTHIFRYTNMNRCSFAQMLTPGHNSIQGEFHAL